MKKYLYLFFGFMILVNFLQAEISVDEIVKKNIEACGGIKKLSSIKTTKVEAKFTLMGVEGPAVINQKRPNKMRIDVTFQGMQIVQAYDGKKAWIIMPFHGSTDPQDMPETEAKSFINDADFDGPLVDYKKKGHKVELLGKEDFEGTPIYKVKLTTKDGSIKTLYFDKEYFLLLKSVSTTKIQEKDVEKTEIYSDFKEVQGIMIPHSIKITGEMFNIEMVFEKIEFNVDIDDKIFNMPEKKVEKKEESKK